MQVWRGVPISIHTSAPFRPSATPSPLQYFDMSHSGVLDKMTNSSSVGPTLSILHIIALNLAYYLTNPHMQKHDVTHDVI